MTSRRYRALALPVVLVVSLAGFLLAQSTPQDQAPPPQTAPPQNETAVVAQKVLIVNGREVPGAVAEVAGRYYLSVDSVAEITNGSLTIEPNRIVLNTQGEVAGANSGAPGAAASAVAPPPVGMTRDFARQALSTLAYMREWKAAVATVVSFGAPVVGTWPDDYRQRVQEGVAQTEVGALSDDDRNALGLLENEAENLTAWSAQVVTARQSLNAEQNVNPNSLANDLTYQKISKCAEFLNGILGAGVFSDDPSCH